MGALSIDKERLYQEIGKRIRAVREERSPKITQSELAELLGVERTSISNIEQGVQRATVHLLYVLAERLQVSLDKLLPTLGDEKIFNARTHLTQVKMGHITKSVPNEVKLFVDKI